MAPALVLACAVQAAPQSAEASAREAGVPRDAHARLLAPGGPELSVPLSAGDAALDSDPIEAQLAPLARSQVSGPPEPTRGETSEAQDDRPQDPPAKQGAGGQEPAPAQGAKAKSDPEDSSEEVLRDPVKSEIAILVRTFYQSYNDRNFAAAKACFWPNATITEVRELEQGDPPRVVVLGAPTFFKELEDISKGTGLNRFGRLAKEPKWRFASNVAQAWCEFVGEFTSGEDKMTWARYDAFTFVHHEGKWLIAALVQSLNVDGQ